MNAKNASAAARFGYVSLAPACGDCAHADNDHEQHEAGKEAQLLCRFHGIWVDDSGRCPDWDGAGHWYAANPVVVPFYRSVVRPAKPDRWTIPPERPAAWIAREADRNLHLVD